MASPFNPAVLKTFAVLLAIFIVLYFAANGYRFDIYQVKDNCPMCICPVSSGTEKDDCVQTTTNPRFNICLFGIDEDLFVSKSIRNEGLWANDLTLKIRAALTFYPNATFVDFGANIGYFTFYACTLSKNVVAIEAARRSTKMIYKGLALNNCKGNVILLNNAISNARTIVKMTENTGKNMGGVAIAKEEAKDNNSPADPSWIESITMDDMLSYIGSKDVVMKMDIEGYECKALESSLKFFQEKTVHYIFMEWLVVKDRLRNPNTACPLEAAQNMVARLASMGFIPAEYSPKQRPLNVKKVASWTANDIVWHRKGSTPV
ncbi:hypothetical protein CHS0354_003066 [Potamilus streckersoni]|uniref:Methyltransferase FkbM domain-containing protein n=1 Tax=Potamilus streckersoni TaxID=2493646 RepID=A0AAE0SEG7_9BIVA|nr:hypothetical protein CHS0354_003066 [Potamilus streckersoni]